RMPADSYQFGGNTLRRQNEIHAAGAHRSLRHGRKLRGGSILRKRHSTGRLDGFYASRTVGTVAGEDHSDGPASTIVRHGSQKMVDGHVRSRSLRTRSQLQNSAGDGQLDVCRYHVYMVGFYRHAIGRFTDRQGGSPAKNLGKHAVVIW